MARRSSPQSVRSVLAALALVVLGFPALAAEQCGSADANGTTVCRAGLPVESLRQLAVVQEQPQWCWAASISMIFAHHGYTVRQEDIVRGGYGVVSDLPAASGQAMTDALSRAWVDEHDRAFQGQALATDALAKQYQVSNEKVLAELAAGRPLLLGAMSHAVVLVGLNFERSASGVIRIVGGTVIDPRPAGGGIRRLQRAEMRPTYVAAVQVMGVEQKVATAAGASTLR